MGCVAWDGWGSGQSGWPCRVGEGLFGDFLGPYAMSAAARSVVRYEWLHPCMLCFPPYRKVGDDRTSVIGDFSERLD